MTLADLEWALGEASGKLAEEIDWLAHADTREKRRDCLQRIEAARVRRDAIATEYRAAVAELRKEKAA